MAQGRRKFAADLDMQGGRIYNEGTLVPTAMSGTVIDFADGVDNVQTLTVALLALQTYTTANLAAGRRKELLITTPLAAATQLAFPAAWVWYGSKLTATILSKEIRLRLTAYGATDSTVRAEWIAQA